MPADIFIATPGLLRNRRSDLAVMRRRIREIETRITRHRDRGTSPTASRLVKWQEELEQMTAALRTLDKELEKAV